MIPTCPLPDKITHHSRPRVYGRLKAAVRQSKESQWWSVTTVFPLQLRVLLVRIATTTWSHKHTHTHINYTVTVEVMVVVVCRSYVMGLEWEAVPPALVVNGTYWSHWNYLNDQRQMSPGAVSGEHARTRKRTHTHTHLLIYLVVLYILFGHTTKHGYN